MKQKKKHYEVYAADVMYIGTQFSELLNDGNFNSYSLMGETWAVSEDKAINNVKYRKFGKKCSQYDWPWKAVEVDL